MEKKERALGVLAFVRGLVFVCVNVGLCGFPVALFEVSFRRCLSTVFLFLLSIMCLVVNFESSVQGFRAFMSAVP